MKSLITELKRRSILVSDGAWGTFLHEKGLKGDECPESWNLTRPDDVFDIARSYVEAGADLILTNSFGGSVFKLESYGLAARCYDINRAAAEISRRAAGDSVLVLGSMGPTGKMLLMGEVSSEDMYDSFRTQAVALAEGGADAIIVETMSDLEEAVLAVRAAVENTELEVACTLTFDHTAADEYRTMMGISPAESVDALLGAGAVVLGANCGNGTAGMIEIVKEFRKVNEKVPLLVHANAGMPKIVEGKSVFPESPEVMACQVEDLVRAGADIIGGCCGTTPDHIREIISILSKKL